MVIALFILMLAIFLIVEYFFFSKKILNNVQAPSVTRLPVSTKTIKRYFHPGHSWALVHSHELVVVGVDDFSQRFIGTLDGIELPQAGSALRQGETMVTLKRGDKSLSQVAPISGTIIEVNTLLADEPSHLNTSPMNNGWIAKISPHDLMFELRNLLKGVVAERWQEAVRAHLVHWFSPRIGTVMQDGGKIVDNVSDLVNNEEWHALVNEFFPQCNSNVHNNT